MTADQIKELLALHGKATPAPWLADGDSVSAHHAAKDSRCQYWIAEELNGNHCAGVDQGRPQDNAASIAAMHNALPELCADITAANARIAELEAIVARRGELLREAQPALREYAVDNPFWWDGSRRQDPNGAHAVLDRIDKELATGDGEGVGAA